MDVILDYVLLHFNSLYGVSGAPLAVQYGFDNKSLVQVRRAEGGFFEGKDPYTEKVIWRNWKGRKIPFFFESDAEESPLISVRGNQVLVGADVIASAFYLLSGWQEYHADHRDQFGRFPYQNSVQHRYGFVEVPVVNYYFDILKTALEQATGTPLPKKLWKGASFATCLTHDVDRLESGWKIGGLAELKRGKPWATAWLIGRKLFGRDAWFNLREVMQLDESYGAKATYFFLCHHHKHRGHPNADYAISGSRYQQLLKQVWQGGHEVAVHGSLATSQDPLRLGAEAEHFNEPVRGNRFHYLCFEPRVTPVVLDEAGMDYDSTLGFAEHFGFRHGYCHPFRLFDFRTRRPFRFLEIPLNLMDVTLNHPRYLQLRPDHMPGAVKPMLQEIAHFGGCFSILGHNESFHDHAFADGQAVYIQILEQVSTRGNVYLTGSAVTAEMRRAGLL